MDRTFSYIIPPKSDGLRIDRFLCGQGYSGRLLAKLRKDTALVLLNGSASRLNQQLSGGDALLVRVPEEKSSLHVVPVELPLDIAYEDEDIIVVNKPTHMPIHPSMDNYLNSLANALAWYYRDSGCFVFRCTNRLDRDTSGLTVIAKNLLSASKLSDMAVRHEIKREYLGIVRSCPQPSEGIIDAPLGRRPGSIIERCVDFENGEPAVTHYKCLEHGNGHSLLSLVLETGRTHQIRIHLKYLGFPLVGDYLYNPDMEFISRQALHSHILAFRHPISGSPLSFESPLPDDMKAVLQPRHANRSASADDIMQ